MHIESVFSTAVLLAVLSFALSLFSPAAAAQWVYTLISKTSGNTSGKGSTIALLIKERQQLHTERSKLSAQDHYAKWTKLNRRIAALDDEIQKQTVSAAQEKRSMLKPLETLFKLLKYAPSTVLRLFMANKAAVSLEVGVSTLPWPFSWIVRMPWGRYNTISVFFLWTAVETVLGVGLSFLKDARAYRVAATSTPTPAPAPSQHST